MASSPSPSIPLTRDQNTLSHITECSNLAVTQANIKMLPFPSFCSPQQRCHDAVRSIQSCRQIRHRTTNFHRRSISRASDVHEAHFTIITYQPRNLPIGKTKVRNGGNSRLNHNIIPRPITIRPRLSIPRNTCINQLLIPLSQTLKIQTILRQRAR